MCIYVPYVSYVVNKKYLLEVYNFLSPYGL